MKIFNLPKVNKAFRNTSWFFENSYVMDFKLCLVISSCNYMEDDLCNGCRLILQKRQLLRSIELPSQEFWTKSLFCICHLSTFVWIPSLGRGWRTCQRPTMIFMKKCFFEEFHYDLGPPKTCFTIQSEKYVDLMITLGRLKNEDLPQV